MGRPTGDQKVGRPHGDQKVGRPTGDQKVGRPTGAKGRSQWLYSVLPEIRRLRVRFPSEVQKHVSEFAITLAGYQTVYHKFTKLQVISCSN